ncbi:hypothetical protein [Chromobacterium vaccinii]|uniref:hypothetical protein n=1 Tax=Chromobacterium vaccinii TaxID=1108595 RepID=UPI0011AB6EFE|nr:hypothetical protein [Chromobacterium vaccinii]
MIATIQASAAQSNQVPSVLVKLSAEAVAAAAAANPPAQAEQATYKPLAAAGFTAAAQTPIPIMPAGYTLGNALAGAAAAVVGGVVAVTCEGATSGLASVLCVPAVIYSGDATSQVVNNLIGQIAQEAKKHPVVTAGPILYFGPNFDGAGHGDGGRANAGRSASVGHVSAGPVSNAGGIGGGEGGD